MSDEDDIPVLDDLIETGIEITLSDLGLDDDPPLRVKDIKTAELEIDIGDAAPLSLDSLATEPRAKDSFAGATRDAGSLASYPALEREVRRILEEHMALAWQEIRRAIHKHLDRS
jgi:hypothetical protein